MFVQVLIAAYRIAYEGAAKDSHIAWRAQTGQRHVSAGVLEFCGENDLYIPYKLYTDVS